jgi:hypothetical protein
VEHRQSVVYADDIVGTFVNRFLAERRQGLTGKELDHLFAECGQAMTALPTTRIIAMPFFMLKPLSRLVGGRTSRNAADGSCLPCPYSPTCRATVAVEQ